MREVPCPVCGGARLNDYALAVTVDGRNIFELCSLPIARRDRDGPRASTSTTASAQIAERVLKEIDARLKFLLRRRPRLPEPAPSAPPRCRAARRSASAWRRRSARGLVGVLYVLDEPSIGLHQRDNHKLIETLQRLRDLGNTVLVVEHDEDTIRVADHVVDIGPGAGEHGGEVVHSGTVAGLLRNKRVAHRPVPHRQEDDPDARAAARAGRRVARRSRAPASTT